MSDSINTIHNEMLDFISNKYDKTVGYPIYDITRTIAIVADSLFNKIDELYKHINPENLSGDELNEYTSQHKGITRKEATKAIGTLHIIGTCDIEYGDLFETPHGVQFYATNDYSIIDSGDISVKAVKAGSAGNVGSGSITLIPVSIPGINSVTNPEPTYDGFDAEDDSSLLSRYMYSLQNPITSNNKAHYKKWALDVSGVGNAKVAPLENGPNTVSVYIVDTDMKPANEELIQRVQNYIDPGASGRGEGEATVGAYCTVKSAIEKPLNISLKVSIISGYNEDTVKQNIATSINEYLKSINFVSTTVSYAHIGYAILNVEGIEDYSELLINGTTDNIELGNYESAVAYITYE